jgi:hypothetical protein
LTSWESCKIKWLMLGNCVAVKIANFDIGGSCSQMLVTPAHRESRENIDDLDAPCSSACNHRYVTWNEEIQLVSGRAITQLEPCCWRHCTVYCEDQQDGKVKSHQ